MIGDRLKFKRDLRVDFFRGVALLTIFIDHVPHNRWASITQQNFGFSDAAEMFVVLAGYSAVLAYGRYIDHGQLDVGIRRVSTRIAAIYLYHLGTLMLTAVTVGIVAMLLNNSGQIERMRMDGLIAGDPNTIVASLLLMEQPTYFDILPLYVVLLAAFPLLYVMLRWSMPFALFTSAALWLIVQIAPVNLQTVSGEPWHFNPFAWQFLLVLGMAAALQVRHGVIPRQSWLIGSALIVLVGSLILRAPWTRWPLYLGAAPIDLGPYGAWMVKTDLGAARLLHIMAFGYLILALVPARAKWLKHPLSRLIADVGSNSLEVFCLGVILSVIAASITSAAGRDPVVEGWVTTVGVAALLTVGVSLARNVRERKRARERASKLAPSEALVGT